MKRRLQQSLAGCAVVLGLSLALLPASTPAPAADPVKVLPQVEKAEHQAYTEKIPGSEVSFDLVPIPGGTYLMGSPPSEKGRGEDEGPQHPVTVRPFWMGKMEVRWDEFDQYWKSEDPLGQGADAITRPTPPYADETFGLGREGFPVICITHHAAMEYCRWLSKKTGKTYRLPTEAEWEWAARAGTTTPYFFGDDPKQLDEYAWYKANSEELTYEVGKKKPNPWGLHDILGNVSEWCLDHYDKDYYKQFPIDRPTLSPVLLPTEKRFPHVTRGGGWDSPSEQLRCAARRPSDRSWIRLDPQRPQSIWWLTSAEFVGFRVVRPVEEQENLKNLRSRVTKQSD